MKLPAREQLAQMDRDERRRFFQDYGFVLLPGAIGEELLGDILEDVTRKHYEQFCDVWESPALSQLIGLPGLLDTVRSCYGEDIRCFKAVYSGWVEPNEQTRERGRQSLHMDYGTGNAPDDYRNTAASWVNCGCYFVDLEPDMGPLWIVPGSHRWTHLTPGGDLEVFGDLAIPLSLRAGDIGLFHCFTIHAGGANLSGRPRHSAFLSYRPAWALPRGPVPEWPDAVIEASPSSWRALLCNLNGDS